MYTWCGWLAEVTFFSCLTTYIVFCERFIRRRSTLIIFLFSWELVELLHLTPCSKYNKQNFAPIIVLEIEGTEDMLKWLSVKFAHNRRC